MVTRRGLALVLFLGATLVAPATAQNTEYTGAPALGLQLRRLGTTKRVLMIGAHPDDENNAVLTALALGEGADVAYLSLTRGEGGQNGIGPELQEGLGLIRSDELLAARRLDGARQYFGREYDYGFSKSADEAFRHWPHDSTLADVVAVIRRYRPDVILSVWSGTPRDGHGQHQAAGTVAREAFAAAADPARFPGQIVSGLAAHRTPYLFQSSWRGGEVAFYLDTGDFDPLYGRSIYQIAMQSRSRHRSQDQGSAETPGPQRAGMVVLAGAVPRDVKTLYDGLDITLSAWARHTLPDTPALAAALEAFEGEVSQATASYNPLDPGTLVPRLGAALAALDRAATLARPLAAAAELRFRIAAERAEAIEALRLASGITVDATADDARVVPGQEFTLTLRVWNGGATPLRVARLEPLLPDGWRATPSDSALTAVAPGALGERRFRVRVADNAQVDEPYFLRLPRQGDLYTWPADVMLRGEPFQPAAVRAVAAVHVQDTELGLEAPATFVAVDRRAGETRLPLLVVPAISVQASPRVAVVPIGGMAAHGSPFLRQVSVALVSEAPGGIRGAVHLDLPPGWRAEPASQPVSFARAGDQATVNFAVTPPAELRAGRYAVNAVFEGSSLSVRRGYAVIEYPHTQPRLLFRDAAVTFSAFPVAVAQGLRVGYIEGAGDAGAGALTQLGVNVELMDAAQVKSGDLTRYDVIVAGIRAYEMRPELVAANRRFLDWAAAGGTFIVQYHRADFAAAGLTPYPVTSASERVTDETAEVRLLDPVHPLLARPNRLGPADFEGWVQERGLYFMSTWDAHYTPLLEMNDPGEAALRGSLLVAEHGRGKYVYVALSLFRQLPEGVPGAYRLLANLVSLSAH
jgi:LmbE family N-acetylglucosaminyl deacetylase